VEAVIKGFDALVLSVVVLLVGCLLTLLLVLTGRWQDNRKP
jgi:hypothetical protein